MKAYWISNYTEIKDKERLKKNAEKATEEEIESVAHYVSVAAEN